MRSKGDLKSRKSLGSKGDLKSRKSLGPRNQKRGPWVAPRDCRVVAGLHSCCETFHVRIQDICEMWLKEKNPQGRLGDLWSEAQGRGIKVVHPPLRKMDELCVTHQGVIIFVSSSPLLDWPFLENIARSQVVVADGVVDPRNLGAIIRTAWLMGVPGVLVPALRSSPLSGAVMRVACGGGEYVAVEEFGNLGRTLKSLQERGFWVYGLAGQAKEGLWSSPLPEKVAWLVGAEEKGLRPKALQACDKVLSIPQVERSASYNVSVALALAMGEYCRQS